MAIGNITFGPAKINGKWYCRLTTPDGRVSELGPFDDDAAAQEFVDYAWPKLYEELKEAVAKNPGSRILDVIEIEGQAP